MLDWLGNEEPQESWAQAIQHLWPVVEIILMMMIGAMSRVVNKFNIVNDIWSVTVTRYTIQNTQQCTQRRAQPSAVYWDMACLKVWAGTNWIIRTCQSHQQPSSLPACLKSGSKVERANVTVTLARLDTAGNQSSQRSPLPFMWNTLYHSRETRSGGLYWINSRSSHTHRTQRRRIIKHV